jgi:hypothetical protein
MNSCAVSRLSLAGGRSNGVGTGGLGWPPLAADEDRLTRPVFENQL